MGVVRAMATSWLLGLRVQKKFGKKPHQDRKVRSLAKKVLGSMRMGVVRAIAPSRGFCGAGRLLKYQSSRPRRFLSRPKPAQRPPVNQLAVEELFVITLGMRYIAVYSSY